MRASTPPVRASKAIRRPISRVRDLPLTHGGSGQQQIGDSGTSDQQHQANDRHQDPQRLAILLPQFGQTLARRHQLDPSGLNDPQSLRRRTSALHLQLDLLKHNAQTCDHLPVTPAGFQSTYDFDIPIPGVSQEERPRHDLSLHHHRGRNGVRTADPDSEEFGWRDPILQQLAEGEFQIIHKSKSKIRRWKSERRPKAEMRIGSRCVLSLVGIRNSDFIRASDLGLRVFIRISALSSGPPALRVGQGWQRQAARRRPGWRRW